MTYTRTSSVDWIEGPTPTDVEVRVVSLPSGPVRRNWSAADVEPLDGFSHGFAIELTLDDAWGEVSVQWRATGQLQLAETIVPPAASSGGSAPSVTFETEVVTVG